MKLVESILDLKVGDKLDAVKRPDSYKKYGVVYLVVKAIRYDIGTIKVSYIDYKGKEITWTYFTIPNYDLVLKFYEGSN